MQTSEDRRTAEAKRLDELALQYRTSRDPEVLAEMRALARRLSKQIDNPNAGAGAGGRCRFFPSPIPSPY